jgi:hypothetical protein
MVAVKPATTETNIAANIITNSEIRFSGTYLIAATNIIGCATNKLVSTNTEGTNIALSPKPESKTNQVTLPPTAAVANFSPFQPQGKRSSDLSPAAQARIDRITESEILGPVMRPLPMALLGIAGEVAFLRSANGQTGLVKEGDSLGDIKLLRIGINRVLIEQDGQKKELTIFSGYGSDSMLQKDTSNENKHP